MKVRSFKLREQAEILVTRRLGEKLRQELVAQIPRGEDPESLLLDFAGVHILDYSCADELVARLLVELQNRLHGQRFLLLCGLDETIEENVAVALKQRSLSLQHNYGGNGDWQLLGELRPYLEESLELLNSSRELTARDLADQSSLAINTASNRLAELARTGLAYRRTHSLPAGGKQFQYYSILPNSL
ncbi:MAG: hypothetical protein FWF06_00580 [Symbiobacteriaceae bacterium]|nr:hypothetical protein [Symbiobacteriaceae bacterium]